MLASLAALALAATPFVDVEGGVAFPGYNDVRIPGDTGTRFSLRDDLETEPAPAFRVRVGARFGDRHTAFLLAAPLRLEARGTLPRDVVFMGGTYPAGTVARAGYRFDSYRVTYRYALVARPALEVALGATAKLRAAAVTLDGAGGVRARTNLGPVPLLSFRVAWWPGRIGLLLDGDALAAPQGRAEDVLVALQARVREGVVARAGYRVLEGGADNDSVYNFTLVHFATVGLEVAL